MQLFFRVSGIVLVLLVFTVIGIVIGQNRKGIQPVSAAEIGRFQKITDTTAFDSKTGQECDTALITPVGVPKGYHLDTGRPLCSSLK